MEDPRELPPEARYGPEVEREATAPPRSTGMALICGGLLGVAMSAQQPGLKLRERLFAAVGSAASLGLGALAIGGPLSLSGPARRAPSAFAGACYGSAAASVALGGGHQTPAYFPAVVLTALGSGVGGDVGAGARGGSAVGIAYLGGCALSLKPWQASLRREDWWNVAAALGFLGGGIVGAIAGDLNLKLRAFNDFAGREGEGASREAMEEAAAEVRRRGARFLGLLREVDEAFAEETAVLKATDELATALGSLRTVRTIPPAEERENLATWPRLLEIAEHYNRGGNVHVSLMSGPGDPPAANAATTGALCESATALIQNAANARRAGRPPVAVEVSLAVVPDPRGEKRRRFLRMTVEDDAGGDPPSPSEWGKGLSECRAAAEELGGAFVLERGQAGVRAVTEVRYVEGREQAPRSLAFSTQAEEGRDACLRALRRVTAAQALFIALSESTERRKLPRRLVAIGAVVTAGELLQRLPARAQSVVAGPLGAVAMSAFRGPGRPPLGGWAAVMCAQSAAAGQPELAWLSAVLATAGATAAAGPERFGAALPTTIGDRTFALLGAAVGASVHKGLAQLEDQEDRVADEAWRRHAHADLAAPVRLRHHLLEPLEDALGAARWREFDESDLGRRLEGTEGDLRSAQEGLERLLRAGDPLRELQHQLARLLAPAPVRLLGERPDRTDPRPGHELEAVRFRLGLIGLGQAIATRVRDHLPTSILLVEPLQELQIHVESGGEEQTRFTIVQVPFTASGHDRADAIVDVASRRAGGRAETRIGNSFQVFVHNSALR